MGAESLVYIVTLCCWVKILNLISILSSVRYYCGGQRVLHSKAVTLLARIAPVVAHVDNPSVARNVVLLKNKYHMEIDKLSLNWYNIYQEISLIPNKKNASCIASSFDISTNPTP